MADENLSFQITFDEVEKLTQEVSRAGKAIGELGEFGREAGRGIDIAASSAVEAAEAILGIDAAARQAAAAVDELTQARDIAVDTGEIEDALAASERLRAEIEEFSAPQTIAIDFTGLDEANRAFEESFAAAQELRSEIEAFESARASVDAVKESVDNLGASLDQAAGQADQSAGAIGGSFGRIGTSIASIGKAAAGAFVGFAAFKSVEQIGQTISNTARTMVKEFVEAEKATINLTSALASIGEVSSENIASVQAFANEIARTTTFEDDAVVSAAALIAQLGRLSGTELTRATESAVQLSAVLGKDLQSAALLVARAAAGSTEALSRYGIRIDDTIAPAERFAEVQRQITERFGGRAQADLLTFGGSVEQLKKSWNELLESFGRTITVFQPAINLLTAGLQKANELLNIPPPRNFLDAAESMKAIEGAIEGVTAALRAQAVAQDRVAKGLDVAVPAFQLDEARKKALQQIGISEQSIKLIVDSGNVQQIEALFKRIERLRVAAFAAGEFDIARDLDRLGALRGRKVEVDISAKGAAEARKQFEFVFDILEKIVAAGGKDLEILDTAKLTADTAKIEDLRTRIIGALGSVEEAIGRAAIPGAESPAGPAVALFSSIKQTREEFVKEFGKLPSDLEKLVNDSLSRLDAIVQRYQKINDLPAVELEIGMKIADPEAITADIQQIVGDSLARASAVEFEPFDVQSLRIPITVDRTNPEALAAIGTSAEDAKKKLEALADFTPNLDAAFQEMSASAQGFQSALVTGFDIAFANIAEGTENLRSVMGTLFKSMVDEALRQLARLAAAQTFKFLLSLLPGGNVAAAVVTTATSTSSIPTSEGRPVPKPTLPDPSETQRAVDRLIESIQMPALDPLVLAIEADASAIPTEFEAPALRLPKIEPLLIPVEFEAPALDLPALEPLSVALALGSIPALEPQAVAVAAEFDARAFQRQIDAPAFEFASSFQRPEFDVADSSTLAFSRFIQSARAPRPPAPSPQPVREIIPRPVNIQITGAVNDGISVRRQLTSGALRTELERSLRRST